MPRHVVFFHFKYLWMPIPDFYKLALFFESQLFYAKEKLHSFINVKPYMSYGENYRYREKMFCALLSCYRPTTTLAVFNRFVCVCANLPMIKSHIINYLIDSGSVHDVPTLKSLYSREVQTQPEKQGKRWGNNKLRPQSCRDLNMYSPLLMVSRPVGSDATPQKSMGLLSFISTAARQGPLNSM